MSVIQEIFSLETLDSRLTQTRRPTVKEQTPPPSSSSSPHIEPAAPSSRSSQPALQTSPSRWNTIEFYLYYLVIVIAVPSMFSVTYELSKESHPNYRIFQSLLKPGWIPGRKVDNSDLQYRGFRSNIPILFSVLVGHFLVRKALSTFVIDVYRGLGARVVFDNVFAVIFLLVVHGLGYFKIMAILCTNYWLVKSMGRNKAAPWVGWCFNLAVLFMNEWTHGFQFGAIFGKDSPLAFLDANKYGGVMPKWQVNFNITMLRIISFNMDYYWSLTSGPNLEREREKKPPPSHLSDKQRVSTPHPPQMYSFSLYTAYTLYTPLYMAGPIITFNDYVTQLMSPPLPSTARRPVFLYAVRFLVALLTMEFVMHYMYVVAISKAKHAPYYSWRNDTPFQLAMIGYFNLHHIWLKLLIPWRFFRLWALLDGVDPPENMLRCMSNNYSVMGFWRAWHRSYNRWNIRYIYIPLGGSGKGRRLPILNTLAVFTFVALWHDLSLTLLTWGWLVTLFILPELTARRLFPAYKYGQEWWYRPLAAMGGVLNVLMLMVANLVGFALGVDGVKQLLVDGVWNNGWGGFTFITAVLGALFVGVQLMFEVREEEARQGLFLGC